MNHRERFVRTLTGKPVDRVPFIKLFGGTNAIRPRWEKERPGLSREIDRILGFEGTYRGWGETDVNVRLSGLGKPVVVEDTASRCVKRWADGTVKVFQKGVDFHALTVEWPVKDRADWERIKAAHLNADDPGRFPPDWASRVEEYRRRDYPLQLTHGGVYGFCRNMMGDERLLFAFYDDPGLVHDIMDTYTGTVLSIWDRMAAAVDFDLIECWEDMASKNGPFISPDMFREFMAPNYRRIAEFAKARGIEVLLVDSDGYIDDLAGLLVEAGVTALYPFEAASGCRPMEVRRRHADLGILGALNKQVMAASKREIDGELAKVPDLIRMGRCIPGPDHFVLSDVSWENYRYFMERLREIVMATEVPAPPAARR